MAFDSNEKRIRFSLPLLETVSDDLSELESKANAALPHLMAALIHNCVSSIRQGVVFGYIPTPFFRSQNEAHQPAVVTADVYCSFQGLESEAAQQQHIQQLDAQIKAMWTHIKKAPHLPFPLETRALQAQHLNAHDQVPFDAYRWAQLMMQFAAEQALKNPTEFAALPLFNLNGMDVQLYYSEQQADRFEVRLDLGPIRGDYPPGLVYQTLLMYNAVEGHDTLCWWALNPNNQHIVLILQQALSTCANVFTPLRSVELAELLLGLTQHASIIWDQVISLSQSAITPSKPHRV